MTSPDPKSTQKEAEGGGILPALLAGAGILAVAALFIFGGEDDSASDAAQNKDGSAAHTANAQVVGSDPKGGVAARQADAANVSGRAKPRLNPRIADAVVTEGMAPVPNKKPEPTSFASVEEEIAYWEKELEEANKMLEIRQRAQGHVPRQEQKARERGSAEEIERFEERKRIVADNLDRAQARVDEVEAKLAALR